MGGTDELIKNAPGGQSLYGVVTGNTVCMSYAYAFKAIADDAGLESMVVTGTAYGADGTGGPHAWNLVKASDGSWRTVDATWDDEGDSSDKEWLMLDQDKPAFGHRTYDASALVDTNLDTILGFRLHLEG